MDPRKEPSPGLRRRSREEEQLKAAGVSVVVAQVEPAEEDEEPEGAAGQDVDSDDQTNAQVSEILSSTL